MTEWTLLKRLLDAVHQHSTMIGRLWLTVMVIFRLLIVAVATEDVYTDEQEMFVCNTLQPGCSTVCYDAFAPISQPRFWVFHIISVSTPSLCFIIYTWHNLSKQQPDHAAGPDGGPGNGMVQDGEGGAYDHSCDSDGCSIPSHKHLGHSLAGGLEGAAGQSLLVGAEPPPLTSLSPASREGRVSGGVLSKCYVFHVCCRALLEVGFLLAQWKLFGFRVPLHFLCSWAPCSHPVDCYVSRPTEKTVFLLFMFCVGLFCILLNLLELNHLGWKKIRQAVAPQEASASWACPALRGYETFAADSSSPTFSLGFREESSTSSLPTLDLEQRPDWTCTLNYEGREKREEVLLSRLETARGQKEQKGERQPLNTKRESRGSRQRSTEVWI